MQEFGLIEMQNHSYGLHKISKIRYGCGQIANEAQEHYEEFIANDLNMLQEKLMEVTGSNTQGT
ncbi:hypothetical protein [Lacrimispora sp.]|uniref:hypothetical protein n=1 Tax=Lacrimispora sp. TaxID=2719234 RepID=UPI0029E74CD1|nr:hypothetical protein [Lacrimispora sp.]